MQKPTGVQCTQCDFSAGKSTAAAQRTPPERPRSCASSGPLRARIRLETAHCNQECSLAPCKATRVCISDARAMNDCTAAALSAQPSRCGCVLSSAPLHSKLCSENTLGQEVSYRAIMHKTARLQHPFTIATRARGSAKAGIAAKPLTWPFQRPLLRKIWSGKCCTATIQVRCNSALHGAFGPCTMPHREFRSIAQTTLLEAPRVSGGSSCAAGFVVKDVAGLMDRENVSVNSAAERSIFARSSHAQRARGR